MTSYQLLFLDRNGEVQLVQSIYAENDEDAIEMASQITARRAAELWSGSRLVTAFRLTPTDADASHTSRLEITPFLRERTPVQSG